MFLILAAGCSSESGAVNSEQDFGFVPDAGECSQLEADSGDHSDAGAPTVMIDSGAPKPAAQDAGQDEPDAHPINDPPDVVDAGKLEPCAKCESTTSGLSCYPSQLSDEWGSCWNPSLVGACTRLNGADADNIWLSDETKQYVLWRTSEAAYTRYECPKEVVELGEIVPRAYKLPTECMLQDRGPDLYECPRFVD